MTLYSDAQQNVIREVLKLLPTIDEALQHMIIQLVELRLEESSILFQDVAEAIGSIVSSLLPLLTVEATSGILPYTTHLREGISQVADAYEAVDLVAVQSALVNKLIPAFHCWQQEIKNINFTSHQLS